MSPLTCTVDLTLDLTAPSTARTLSDVLLRHWGVRDPDGLDAVAIVVSDLVTTALTTTGDDGGTASLGLGLDGPLVRVVLRSGVRPVPRMREAGSPVLASLTSRWGAEPDGAGTRTFAEVPVDLGDRSPVA